MRHILVRGVTILATIILSWAVLSIGTENRSSLQVRDIATQDYVARQNAEVVDNEATELAREDARAAVEAVQIRDPEIERQTVGEVEALFAATSRSVLADPEPLPPPTTSSTSTTTSSTTTTSTTIPTTTTQVGTGEGTPTEEEPTTTTTSSTTTTTTTIPPVVFTTLVGSLFVDINSNGSFDSEVGELGLADAGFPRLGLIAQPSEGAEVRTETQSDGSFSIGVPVGTVTLIVDTFDPDFPPNYRFSTEGAAQTLQCQVDRECQAESIGISPLLRTIESQVAELSQAYPDLAPESHFLLAQLASGDVVRQALGRTEEIPRISTAVQQRLNEEFAEGIDSVEQLDLRQQDVVSNPPLVFDSTGARNQTAQTAAGDIVVHYLRQNVFVDEQLTQNARDRAAEDVEEVTVSYSAGQLIVAEGQTITNELMRQAILDTNASLIETVAPAAMGVLLAVVVGLLMFYLSRFRPIFWSQISRVSLLGLLMVLGAAAVRLAVEVQEASSWYVLPAVAFGYLAAVLFDARMGALMALTLAVMTGAGTQEAGVTIFALLATMAPIGFVSAVSTRRAFRNSVVVSALVVGIIAASVAWLFDFNSGDSWTEVLISAGWAASAALIAALIALAALPFFESLFDITTTLRILDLTDRNHAALQLIQAEAFGTFNHSLMVGTLADAAASSIGANNLLARSAAYYHDIGKTENPGMFIENQFGSANPHDQLSPAESAKVIRAHVSDGIRLAKKYRIPSEVSEGILAHHGDAIMRYFYNRACELYGEENVDPDDYRHVGHKPQSKEMAIVMLADSVEGACRAILSEQEPTPELISDVIDRVVDEKLDDGQLSESPLTLADLTKIRQAFTEAMVGHYHHRIPYPNFPGAASTNNNTPVTTSITVGGEPAEPETQRSRLPVGWASQ